MLKLEKISKREIGVRFQKREGILSPLFLKALAIALGLHLSALLFFQIQSFKISKNLSHPPITVNTEIVAKGLALAQLETANGRHRYRLKPKSSSPKTPEMAFPDLIRKIDTISNRNISKSSPFQEIEENLTLPSKTQIARIPPPLLEFSLYGPLSDLKMVEYPKAAAFEKRAIAKYEIQVDSKSGKIIWFDLLQPSGESDFDEQTNEILRKIRFETRRDFAIIKGQIEIRLT